MNARHMKKRLKKQIDKLQSDNDLMRRIISDSPGMQELYDAYTKPLNVTHTTLPFQEFRAKRIIPAYISNEGLIEMTKKSVAEDLFKGIKENITYEIDHYHEHEHMLTSITGSIFISRK